MRKICPTGNCPTGFVVNGQFTLMACAERGAPNEANHANHNLDASARTWECVIPGIMDWIHEAQSKTQRKLAEMSVEPWTVFSGSCLSGYGVRVVPPAAQLYTGGILVCAGKWHYDEHMNVLEARACKIGIEALPWQQEVTPLNIIVDNTALLGSGRKTTTTVMRCRGGKKSMNAPLSGGTRLPSGNTLAARTIQPTRHRGGTSGKRQGHIQKGEQQDPMRYIITNTCLKRRDPKCPRQERLIIDGFN